MATKRVICISRCAKLTIMQIVFANDHANECAKKTVGIAYFFLEIRLQCRVDFPGVFYLTWDDGGVPFHVTELGKQIDSWRREAANCRR